MKKYIVLVLFLSLTNLIYGQCDLYHLSYSCRPSPQEAKDMILSSQSKSAYIEAQQTYNFQLTLFGRMDYLIIFCSKNKFYPIHFIITDKDTGSVLFDNVEDEYVESIGFSTDNTMNVNVEFTLLASKAKFKDLRQNRACLGIPILYRRIPKTGF